MECLESFPWVLCREALHIDTSLWAEHSVRPVQATAWMCVNVITKCDHHSEDNTSREFLSTAMWTIPSLSLHFSKMASWMARSQFSPTSLMIEVVSKMSNQGKKLNVLSHECQECHVLTWLDQTCSWSSDMESGCWEGNSSGLEGKLRRRQKLNQLIITSQWVTPPPPKKKPTKVEPYATPAHCQWICDQSCLFPTLNVSVQSHHEWRMWQLLGCSTAGIFNCMQKTKIKPKQKGIH